MTHLLASKRRVLVVIHNLVMMLQMIIVVCATICSYLCLTYQRRLKSPKSYYRVYQQLNFLYGLVFESDVKCLLQLRMDRQTFKKLVLLLREKGGLVGTKNVPLEKMLAIFCIF